MRWLVPLAAALLGACSGWFAAKAQTALRGPAPETRQEDGVTQLQAQAPASTTFLPAWAFQAVDVTAEPVAVEVIASAAGGDVHAIGPGSAPFPADPTTPAATAWPDQLTESEVRAVLAAAGWPAELHDAALRVARCESSWSPGALGDHGGSLGLFQVNALWFRHAGEDVAQWADPVVNARAALGAYHYSAGWRQWTCRP